MTPLFRLAIHPFAHCSIERQECTLTGSGVASRFAFQFARAEFIPLLTESIAEFLVAGFLNASCAALVADLTPCDLAISPSNSGRDAKYLDTRHEHGQSDSGGQRVPELV